MTASFTSRPGGDVSGGSVDKRPVAAGQEGFAA